MNLQHYLEHKQLLCSLKVTQMWSDYRSNEERAERVHSFRTNAEILQKILSPIVGEQKSYIKMVRDLLRKLPYHNNLGCKLLSCDVTIYTSIPNSLGLEDLHNWIIDVEA